MLLRVTSQKWHPFVDFEEDTTKDGGYKMVGILGKLIEEICRRLNATYKVVIAAGPYDKMLEKLDEGEADIALALFEVNAENFKQNNFTVPLFFSPKSIISKQGESYSEDVFDSFRVIDLKVWSIIFMFASGIPFLIWISEWIKKEKSTLLINSTNSWLNVSKIAWDVLTLCIRQSIQAFPSSPSAMILIGSVLFAVLITTTALSCYIRTELVMKHERSGINNLEDLDKNKHVTPTFFRNDPVEAYFMNSTNKLIRSIWERAMADGEKNRIRYEEYHSKAFAESIATGTHVYITETMDVPYSINIFCKSFPESLLHASSEQFAITSYSGVFGHTLSRRNKVELNNIIKRLQNAGIMIHWLNLADEGKTNCLATDGRRNSSELVHNVSFAMLNRIFLLWFCGMAIATGFLGVEIMVGKYKGLFCTMFKNAKNTCQKPICSCN